MKHRPSLASQVFVVLLTSGAIAACKGKEITSESPADAGPTGGTTGGDTPPVGGGTDPAGGESPPIAGGSQGGEAPPGGGEPSVGGGPAPGGAVPSTPEVAPYPGGCGQDSDCAIGVCRLGVCVEPPPRERSANFACDDRLVEGSEPDFSCWGTPPELDTLGPDSVPMRGKIEYFGSGNVTRDLRVRLYDYATFDPSPCLEVATGINDITQARTRVETCIDENSEPLVDTTSVVCEDDPSVGCYTFDSVPTRLQLVIRVSGDPRLWVPTYEYGQFLNPCVQADFKEDGTCPEQRENAPPDQNWSCSLRDDGAGAVARLNLNVVSQATWTTFPPTAGVARIQTNRGAIAGRQYDCDGRPVVAASVGFHNPGARTTYFNGNPDDTLPQPGLKFTNTDATFANLDTPAGPQGVVSVAWQGDGDARALVTVNFNRIFLVPNSLIILSASGRNPIDFEPPYP